MERFESVRPVVILVSAWTALVLLTGLSNRLLDAGSFAVIALPWLAVVVLLLHPRTSGRMVESWRHAASSTAGLFGITGLLLMVCASGVLLTAPASLLALIWLMSAVALAAATLGGPALAGQLAGWFVLSLVTGTLLLAAEWVLLRPSVAAEMGTPRELASWADRYDRIWEQNILGIRSPYEVFTKPDGVTRVVAVGDSFTWGDKIADSDSTWPAQLEAELHRRLPGREFEVINLGRNGFTTVNEAEMLRRVGWQFDPDLVVVQYFFNDILPSGPNFAREPGQWVFPRTRILPGRYRAGPVGRSALLQFVEGRIGSFRNARIGPPAERWAALYDEETRYWRDMAGALREMGESARERNVPIVFMMFPFFLPGDRSEEPLQESPYVARVAERAKEAGFTVLDLVPVYTEEGGDWRRWWATPYDPHPNEAAAGVAARALADLLLGEMALWE